MLSIPPLIATIGGVGAIIGSTATTKLALGLIKPTFSSIKEHINEIVGAWIASIVMFVIYVILSSVISGTLTLGEMLNIHGSTVNNEYLGCLIMIFIAYTVAIYTFRRGWNPDNFVIPIESSLADTVTTAAVLVALALII